MKDTVDVFPPYILLSIRFTIASILLGIIFFKRLKQINFDYVWKGAVIGLLLFLAYSTQTIGITETTPGKNAFLTAVYCVIVPFLFWLVDRSKPDRYNFFAAFICISGIGLVALKGDFSIGYGDAFTLLGGFLFAGHMVSVAKLGKEKDPIILTILQFAFAALFSWCIGLAFEKFPGSWGTDNLIGLLYLAVFATAAALLFQNMGQKWTHPSAAAIILSLESVFGVLFSIVFYGEQLTGRLTIGFLMIFIAVVVSETKLSFIKDRLIVKKDHEKAANE
ncbi:EamA-like transporter family protein [Ruminiclostridium hungatei]|uniref:EamA-like transporter family protein n=2 Tax=Ruminiclostridium hungatei TaxID=48256 RepID=A0A1V4SJM5_RUMHU|nr:EamA-like transporter family protein [Ruminiclostridium hungatei]